MCPEQSERGGDREEGRAGRGQGRSRMALWAAGRTWAFTPRRWDPGGLWAEEERGLSQLLVGAFWSEREGAQEETGGQASHG